MRILAAILLMLSFSKSHASDDLDNLKSLEATASNYRMMAIRCITDIKITKKQKKHLDSCQKFQQFVQNEYQVLKDSLQLAQDKAKHQGRNDGLNNDQLREKLVLIMSTRSHMNIAGGIAAKL